MMDVHTVTDTPDEDVLELMRERMNAYIFPNVPVTDEETEAYEKAVLWQYRHDASLMAALEGAVIPAGAVSFKIGDFQMAFESGTLDQALNHKNICPSVYGLLLRHGLLYKGVDGRCW